VIPTETTTPSTTPPKERAIHWRILGRRTRRPAFAIVLLSILAAGALAAAGYAWTHAHGCPPEPTEPKGHFRFDEVHVIERRVDGNNTTFSVIPWMSNEGKASLGNVRLVIYMTDSARNLAIEVGSFGIGVLAARKTLNASLEFRLLNTRSYNIEILVLEDDFLIAKGRGSIGFYFDLQDERYGIGVMQLRSDEFSYDYYVH
jgi:hypothetical protein